MAKDSHDEETSEIDYGDLYNEENPVDSLGDLDMGDELEPDQPAGQGADDDASASDTGSGQPASDAGDDDQADGGEPSTDEESEDAGAGESGGEEAAASDDNDGDHERHEDEDERSSEPREKPRDKQPVIPKSRFDQRTAQLRAAERELEQAQTRLKEMESEKARVEREANTLTDDQIQEKMNAANSALVEGNTEEAAKLQSEVFTALRQGTEAQEGDSGEKAVDPNKIAADVRDQMEFEQTLEKLYEDYPALNENSESFDESVSQEAVELQSFYFQQGYTRSQSTQRAVAAVAQIHGLSSQSESKEDASAPKETPKAKKAKEAQKQSRREKVNKSRRAPPEPSGSPSQKESGPQDVDINTLSVDEWAALPDSVRSRLMGDEV